MADWFEVDAPGMRELQLGKPKVYAVRELIQNAFDENTTFCIVKMSYKDGLAEIGVEDDSPGGFDDLKDIYTIFKRTRKRQDPTKRGRFNMGNKQAIAIAESASIETTKGMMVFDSNGRRVVDDIKREKGSKVSLNIKMTETEYNEILEAIKRYNPPENIKFVVNDAVIPTIKPYKTAEATLVTEKETDGVLKRCQRKTNIDVLKPNKDDEPYLYELGIPVTPIDCAYSIDVQQRIPMSIDREAVSQAYIQDVYAEVLNAVYSEIDEQGASDKWVRIAMSDERVSKEAVQEIIKKRYGDKVVIANPRDPNSIDEAIAKGYKVVYGSEMSKEEWANVKGNELMESSTQVFGADWTDAKAIEPNENQKKIAQYSRKVAKRLLNVDLGVVFVSSPKTQVVADFGCNVLRFNISRLPKTFFDITVSPVTTSLILHELAHKAGNHTEHSYHELLTSMAGGLVEIALTEPKFFDF